jgi:hypothetical protein
LFQFLKLASRPSNLGYGSTVTLLLNNQLLLAATSPSRLCVASIELDHERVANTAFLSSFARRIDTLFDSHGRRAVISPAAIELRCAGSRVVVVRASAAADQDSKQQNSGSHTDSLQQLRLRKRGKHFSQNLRLVHARQRRRTILSPHSEQKFGR